MKSLLTDKALQAKKILGIIVLYIAMHAFIFGAGYAEFKLADSGHWILGITIAVGMIIAGAIAEAKSNYENAELIKGVGILQVFGFFFNGIWFTAWPQDFADLTTNVPFVAVFSLVLTGIVQICMILDDLDAI